jgi:hypothetical protein
MRVHDAASKILTEEGRPLSAKDIARQILARALASSSAQDPVFSISSTIEKTIRDGIYNDPELAFIQTAHGRLIGLPAWDDTGVATQEKRTEPRSSPIIIRLPPELHESVQLAMAAGLASNEQEAVAYFVKRGAAAAAPAIQAGLENQIKRLKKITHSS